MSQGGARNRSGPQPNPNSGRSDTRGLTFTSLPNEGYQGDAPEWPLMPRRVYRWEHDDKRRFQVFDEESTALVAEREQELWEWAWRTPQAVAWAREPWRWVTVANWCRTQVIVESDEATAADKGAIHRFADQIGLTPAGLKENGWAIATPEIEPQTKQKRASSARDRIKVVNG